MAADKISFVKQRRPHDRILTSNIVVVVRNLREIGGFIVAERAANERPTYENSHVDLNQIAAHWVEVA